MARKTVTRCSAEVGLSAYEYKVLVEQALDQITDCLARGEAVKLFEFGLFTVRQKGSRIGRNPRMGEPAPISPGRVLSFRPICSAQGQNKSITARPRRLSPGRDLSFGSRFKVECGQCVLHGRGTFTASAF
jgi:integration host factor subunit alpha